MADHPSNRITLENLKNVFTYHAPTEGQKHAYEAIRTAALEFARVVLACTPESADQEAAVRHIREAVMTANAAVALEP